MSKHNIIVCFLITCLTLVPTSYVFLSNLDSSIVELKVRFSEDHNIYNKWSKLINNDSDINYVFDRRLPTEHELFEIIKSVSFFDFITDKYKMYLYDFNCSKEYDQMNWNVQAYRSSLELIKNSKKNEIFIKLRTKNSCSKYFFQDEFVKNLNLYLSEQKFNELERINERINFYKSKINFNTVDIYNLELSVLKEKLTLNSQIKNPKNSAVELIEVIHSGKKNSLIRYYFSYFLMIVIFFILIRTVLVQKHTF